MTFPVSQTWILVLLLAYYATRVPLSADSRLVRNPMRLRQTQPNTGIPPARTSSHKSLSRNLTLLYNPFGDVRIAVLDFGAKANILRSLIRRGAACTVLPWNHDFNSIRDQYDGLFLSNDPGGPAHCMEALLMLRKTIEERNKPIFGICMGHQVIDMAAGIGACRMTFGNRGHNQPVLALVSSGSIKAGRMYVTR